MPGSELRPFETKTQSYRGPGISPLFQDGVARIVSWYIPVVADGLDGAQKIARAEWNTLMFSAPETTTWGEAEGEITLMPSRSDGSEAICWERYCWTRFGRFGYPMCCPRPSKLWGYFAAEGGM